MLTYAALEDLLQGVGMGLQERATFRQMLGTLGMRKTQVLTQALTSADVC
jgi:hypothetical protein